MLTAIFDDFTNNYLIITRNEHSVVINANRFFALIKTPLIYVLH